MESILEKIQSLNPDAFNAIPSQTSLADRKSLLANQRATAQRATGYAYLEIGSHLGGSIHHTSWMNAATKSIQSKIDNTE